MAACTASVPPSARLNKNSRCGQYSEARYSNEAIVNSLTVYHDRALRLRGTFQKGIVPLRVGFALAGKSLRPERCAPYAAAYAQHWFHAVPEPATGFALRGPVPVRRRLSPIEFHVISVCRRTAPAACKKPRHLQRRSQIDLPDARLIGKECDGTCRLRW